MSSANIETARRLYELFATGKFEEVPALLSEDFVVINPLPAIIPFGGRYEGAEGFLRYVQGIALAIEIEAFEVDEILCDGDGVTVTGSERSRVKSTGRTYTMEWVHVLRVSEGKIHALREYNDTAAMRDAFEPDS